MTVSDYIAGQLREAMGPVNKWYCAQHYGREIIEPETLLRYYIYHGGTWRFAQEHAAQVAPARDQAF